MGSRQTVLNMRTLAHTATSQGTLRCAVHETPPRRAIAYERRVAYRSRACVPKAQQVDLRVRTRMRTHLCAPASCCVYIASVGRHSLSLSLCVYNMCVPMQTHRYVTSVVCVCRTYDDADDPYLTFYIALDVTRGSREQRSRTRPFGSSKFKSKILICVLVSSRGN